VVVEASLAHQERSLEKMVAQVVVVLTSLVLAVLQHQDKVVMVE
jgi:hypothetical protein